MIAKDSRLLTEFEKTRRSGSRPDYLRSLQTFEALYEEATYLGVFPLKNPLEGLEVDIRIAKVINVSGVAGENRP
jgi:hypothetical protein